MFGDTTSTSSTLKFELVLQSFKVYWGGLESGSRGVLERERESGVVE